MNRGVGVLFALSCLALGCGDSAGHTDTGVGAGETPPATENCVNLCARVTDCAVALCDEDTMSTRYDALGSLLEDQCRSTCTDAEVQAKIPATAWQCLFQSSCRGVFEHDVCHAMSHYNCN